MKTYSVKQISEMLDTNPETVRRWIRDKKLRAIQTSRKGGNVVSDADFKRFLKATPKYTAKVMGELPTMSAVGVVGSVVAGAVLAFYDDKNNTDKRVTSSDLLHFLSENVEKINDTIQQKEALLKQTQLEIAELEKKREQYNYLISHNQIIEEALENMKENDK